MNIDLADTSTPQIQNSLRQARHLMGGPAVGMVLTLVIVTDESAQYDAVRAATEAAREHPCRVVTVISRGEARNTSSRLDAEIRIGETGPGETVLLRMYGPVAEHSDTVVIPLLVQDTPVISWWPGRSPEVPSEDPLGQLAQRRVTDAYAAGDRLGTLARLGRVYRPGDTDFSWTRLTPWRTLLAASLDQPHGDITSGVVEAEPNSPSADLLACWLSVRLAVPVERAESAGPGVTAVRLATAEGELAVTRSDGRVASLSRPGQPDRQVALHRRPITELLAEELRRLDPDEVYEETVIRFAKNLRETEEQTEAGPANTGTAKSSTANTGTANTGAAKSAPRSRRKRAGS
jgi:glucose-6-phosphate dehydrogenase assembly protein OpcA